jgi:hypothetical protein
LLNRIRFYLIYLLNFTDFINLLKAGVQNINTYYFKDRAWEYWGTSPLVLGSLLAILGILLQILEIVRIYLGIYNFAAQNHDFSDNLQFNTVNVGTAFFLFGEPWHYWPWTYAANAIGLIVLLAGLAGIVSAFRRSYTTVYTFYAFSLMSLLLTSFLIVYYAILISYYQNYTARGVQIWNANNRPDSADYSYGIAGTNLALSILTIIISLIAVIAAVNGGKIGIRRKDYVDYFGYQKYSGINASPYAPPPTALMPSPYVAPTTGI